MDEPTPAGKRQGHPVALSRCDLLTRKNARSRRLFLLALVSSVTVPACNQGDIETWLSVGENRTPAASLYTAAPYGKALVAIRRRVGAPIQALSLLVYPDHLVLQARSPSSPTSVLQYVYRAGVVSTPVPVKLLGTGKLADNLFPLDAAKVDAVPRLAREAKAKANIPEGSVARILLKRNLPESMDIQFRVFVTSQRRDAYLDADQSGAFID